MGIIINGKKISGGGDITIKNGQVFIGGNKVDNVSAGQDIKIVGDIENLVCDGSVTVEGNCGSVKAGGSIKATNIKGDAKAGGSIKAETLHGNAQAGGSVKIDRKVTTQVVPLADSPKKQEKSFNIDNTFE